MRIPKEFTNELLAKTDIIEVIDARVPLKKAGNNYQACCPFHTEKTPSFSVNANKQFYYCFGCGKSGNAITFLIDYERLNFVEAVKSLAAQAGLAVPQQKGQFQEAKSYTDLYELLEQISRYYQAQLKLSKPAMAYLNHRGLSPETIANFQIGFAPQGWDNLSKLLKADDVIHQQLHQTGMTIEKEQGGYYDRFRERIMFPILDRQGRTVGFGGRVLADGTPKYLNSPETPIFHKGSELYGLYQANKAHTSLDNILIVEGYMDTIALVQYGITNVAATLGTATTKQHLERLFRYTPNIIFCFDGDKAGKKAAWRALQTTLSVMTDGCQVRFLFLPDNEDPDTLIRKEGTEQFKQRLNNATPLSQFFFNHLRKEVDLTSLDGRSQFVKLAKPLIQQIPAAIFQQMMLEELGKIARVSAQTMSIGDTSASYQPTQTTLPKSKQKSSKRLSPVRLAIALLLHHPQLAEHIKDIEQFRNSHIPGVDIFINMLEIIRRHPDISTAILIEHWRNTEHEPHLNKLLQWEHMIDDKGVEKEFIGATHRIHQMVLEQKIEALMQKASIGELANEDKRQLQNFIAEAKKSLNQ